MLISVMLHWYISTLMRPKSSPHPSEQTFNHADKPVANHFIHLSILVLEVMRSRNEDLQRMREGFWYIQLHSLHAGGLNLVLCLFSH